MTTELNLDFIAELVAKMGVPAEVHMTGGGVATLFAGEPDDNGYYPAVLGPGTYSAKAAGHSTIDLVESFLGLDGDEDAYIDVASWGASSEEDVAKIVVAQAKAGAGSRPRLVESWEVEGMSHITPPSVVEARAATQRFIDQWNKALHEQLAAGKTTAEAVAAAQLSVEDM